MFDTINGLPIHPLVVHAIVVLLPLSVIGTIAIAFRRDWRHKYGVLVVLVELAAVVLTPVATSSGEELEKHVGDPGEHAELGDQLVWFALPLLVLTALMVWLDRRQTAMERLPERVPEPVPAHAAGHSLEHSPQHSARPVPAPSSGGIPWLTIVSVLAVVVAVATGIQVYRVGDSGARAAWGDQVSSSTR